MVVCQASIPIPIIIGRSRLDVKAFWAKNVMKSYMGISKRLKQLSNSTFASYANVAVPRNYCDATNTCESRTLIYGHRIGARSLILDPAIIAGCIYPRLI